MTTFTAYARALRDVETAVAEQLGCRLDALTREQRIIIAAGLVPAAVIVKTLTDNGVITDAQLLATVRAAAAELWPPEPAVTYTKTGSAAAAGAAGGPQQLVPGP